ncbi:zinc finger and SCAN domain-containing protein 12-like [Neocloeon triangulifer]|uniref:zinc finger and SCAN domain-containing protein 12-like n=1 Tax=Neocloeon triangulifer TaxID=2078957 RepID=UPI00286F94DE|nr:zinc finger and SCAN domain-containing protein 12-like [Neocloeon triangulifer]
MSWKEVLKPSIAEYERQTVGLSVCSDGQDSNEGFGEDKMCCGMEMLPESSASTYELVCVDEWLKSRTESMSSMDMDVSMTDAAAKENTNLSELDQFLTPKGAVDLCMANENQNLSEDASSLLLSDDLLCKPDKPRKTTLETPLFLVEEESRLKDEDGLVGRRGSWTEHLEKDKSNWDLMSNTSQKSHELVKEVDFPEFNLVPPFDQICSIEMPDSKELIEDPLMDKVVEVLPKDLQKEQNRDPLMTSVQDEDNATETVLINSVLDTSDSMKNEEDLAIIAISANSDENTAQIIISTGPTVFQAEESVKKQDAINVEIVQDQNEELGNADEIMSDEEEEEEEDEDNENSLMIAKSDEEEDEVNEEDEQPLIEALAAIGIKVESLMYVKTDSQHRMWMCPVKDCRKMYSKQSALKVHILSHYGLRPFKCDYEGCFWSFYTHFRLKRHKATHLKKKDFLCTYEGCGRKFTTIYNLHTHQKLHERPAENVCTVAGCEASFQTKRKLELHLKEHDSSHAPYKCHYCKRGYYSINSLNMHIRGHEHKEEEVICQWAGCGKRFDKPCRLRAHMRSHTGDRPYICTFEGCKWSFSTASKLRRHSQKHTDERNFKCPMDGCPKAFLRPEHLREHILTHQGTKNWECPVAGCEARFTAKSSLYVHVKKHKSPTTKDMFVCPFENCNHKYLRKASLRHHVVKNHQVQLVDDSSTESPAVSNNFLAFPIDGQEILIGQTFSVSDPIENAVVLSTINPADIMLSSDPELPTLVQADDSHTNLNSINVTSNLSNLLAEESEDDSHVGCARTNLPLPLVPRKANRTTNVLPAPALLPEDIFNDSLLVTPQGIEFQIMLDTRQREFAESTINLRDLE